MGKLSNKWAGGVLLVVCGCFLIDKGVHWGFERMLACMEGEMLEEPDSVLVYLKGNWRWSQDFEESTAARYALMYVDALYQTNRIVDDSALNVACSYYMGQGNDDESHRLVAQLYYGISLYQKHREKEALPYLLEVYESRERLMIPGREVLLLSYLKSIYYRSGLYEEARTRLGMIDSIPIVNNKVVPGGVQAKDIAVAEMRYEQEKERRAYWQWGMAVVSFLFVVILLTFYYAVRKKLRERELMAEILGYTRRINELDARSEENEKVQKEKDLLLERIKYNEKLLFSTKNRLKQSENNHSQAVRKFAAAMLVKNYLSKDKSRYGDRAFDYRFLVEGYDELGDANHSYCQSVLKENPSLTSREIFICILRHEGFVDNEIAGLVGVSASTFKVIKSRMASKAKDK